MPVPMFHMGDSATPARGVAEHRRRAQYGLVSDETGAADRSTLRPGRLALAPAA